MVHETASPEASGVVRIVVCGIWLVTFLLYPLTGMADFPLEWFQPYGPARLVPEALWRVMLQPSVLSALQVALIGLGVLVLLGMRPHVPFALGFAVLVTVGDAINRAFIGGVSHTQLIALYGTWILVFFPASDGLSILGRRRPAASPSLYAAPLLLLSLVIVTSYMLIGTRRLVYGGLELFTGDAILRYLSVQSLNYSRFDFDYGLIPLTSAPLALLVKAGFFISTVMEITSPIAVLNASYRRVWLAIMVPFHVMVLFTMNILFWENMLLAVVLFTPLAHQLARRKAPMVSRPTLFYDGDCGLCHGFVQFVFARDRGGVLAFAPLQGNTAARQIPHHAGRPLESVILADENGIHERSEAALRALAHLGGIWVLAGWLTVVPRPVRNFVYDFVAARRYRWFGYATVCLLPGPEARHRFLP